MKDNQNYKSNRYGKKHEPVKGGRPMKDRSGRQGYAKQHSSHERSAELPSRPEREEFSFSSVEEREESGLVVGRNAVRELLKSGRAIDKLLVQRGEREGSIVVLVAQAIEKGIPVIEVEKSKLDNMAELIRLYDE